MLTRRRLYLANTDYNIDLSDHGNPNPGTPVTLWGKWEGGTNQTWRFEEGAFLFAFSFSLPVFVSRSSSYSQSSSSSCYMTSRALPNADVLHCFLQLKGT